MFFGLKWDLRLAVVCSIGLVRLNPLAMRTRQFLRITSSLESWSLVGITGARSSPITGILFLPI